MRRISLLIAASIVAVPTGIARAGTLTAEKTIEFTWNPKVAAVPGIGSATWGRNTADDKNVNMSQASGPESVAFNLNTMAASLAPTKKATATAGGAKSEVTIGVGQVMANPNGTVKVAGSIKIELTTPGGKGGSASGAGRINLNGATAVTGLKLNGKVVAGNMIAKTIGDLKTMGAALDPLHLTIFDPLDPSIAVLDEDFFNYGVDFSLGASAGINTMGQLELELPDDPFFPASVTFFSVTLVDWATDLTGTASLIDGVFTSTGIYESLGLWTLAYSAFDPTYVIRATLDDVSMSNFSLDIEAPVPSDGDFDFEFSSNLTASLVTVPEPSTLALAGLAGLLIPLALRGRRKQPANTCTIS